MAVKHGRYFNVRGSLKPHFAAGAKTVKIVAYRYRNHQWLKYRTYRATNVDQGAYTKYLLKVRIAQKGKFRFRAFTSRTTVDPIFSAASTRYSKLLLVK